MKELITFDDDKLALIKRTVAKDATDDELALFLHQARRMGLDPLARQIHFQKFKSKNGKDNVSFITTVDGYRLIADRTGRYAGNREPVFDGVIKDANYGYSQNGPDIPAKATVTVYKVVGGKVREFSHSAYWKEYYPGQYRGHMWRQMPHVMLAKCAEAGALRKAFPADLSGVYTRDEMDQAHNDIEIVESEPEQEQLLSSSNGQADPQVVEEIDDGLFSDPGTAGRVADVRTVLEDLETNTILRRVAILIVNTGLYNHENHVWNALKLAPENGGFKFPARFEIKANQRITKAGALQVFDWAVARKMGEEEE